MKYVCMLLYTLFAPLSYSIETHESWIHNDIQEQLQTSESTLDDVENKFEHEHCKAVGHIGFDAYTPNDCVFSCNSRPVGKSITFDEFLGKWVTYVKVFAPDGYDCRNNGYCLGGQCTEKTITIVNTSSTDFTDSWKESTSPKRDKKSSDFTSPSSDGVISSLDSKTTRDLITNDDSSDNNTISNDIDYFKGSTTPEIISHFNNITTPPSGTTFDASEPVGLELQIMNEHCERAKEGYFFALLPNKCFIACTLDKYLAYHPDKDNDDTYQTVREITMFLENYKEVFINDGQCVKRTTADSNTISTDVTDSVKESTTPKSVASLDEHISLSTDGITSSLDSTTPCYLITNDDSSDNKTISNDIDDSKGSTTPKSILNFNNATTTDSNTISTNVTDFEKESTTPESIGNSSGHISSSSNGVTSSLDLTTPRYLLTNDHSSDNKTISKDINDFKESTTPKSNLNLKNATTTDSNTISTNVTDFVKESTTPESFGNSSDHMSSSSNGITSSLDSTTPRYLLTNDHSSDNKTISKDIDDFKESTTPKSNLNLKNATTTDSNTISTNVTDFVKESTTPERFGNSSDHISSSSNGITSSLDSTTPRHLITNDDSSDNKTISKGIDDFKESTTRKSILNFNNASTPQSGTTSGTSYPVRQKLTDSDTTDKMTTPSSESDGFNNNFHNSRTSLPIDTVNKELSTPKYSTISNTLKSPHRELQILNEQCNRYGLYYFFSYPDNKCVLACTASEFLAYHPSKQNNFFYQTLSRFNIQVNNYGQISVQDGLKCSDNGYCQNGQCLEKIKSVTPSFLSMEAFFGLSNNECKKIGTYGAYSVSSIDCALNCMMINPYSGYLTINQKVAPNGFPCSNNRICYEGTCRRISKGAIYTIRRY